MRYAIISDIHGNLEALTSVLAHIRKRQIKDIICLGDIVGYGPYPVECTKLVMENCNVSLKGNHDEALIEGVCFFHSIAKSALEWTRKCFLESNLPNQTEMWQFMTDLPLLYTLDHYMFVHGSPIDPTSDYIFMQDVVFEEKKFKEIFNSFDDVLFTGHTHMPCVITEKLETLSLEKLGYKYQQQGQKAIINVGSVGQPRDKDPRACYVEVIDNFFFFHRVPYDCNKVCQDILANHNLDEFLGKRLLTGS